MTTLTEYGSTPDTLRHMRRGRRLLNDCASSWPATPLAWGHVDGILNFSRLGRI